MDTDYKTETKKRGRYGRPCDVCALRRIRCVFREKSDRCDGCINRNVQCTNLRVRKVPGPKRIQKNKNIEDGVKLVRDSGDYDQRSSSNDNSQARQFTQDNEITGEFIRDTHASQLLRDDFSSGLDDLLNCFKHDPKDSARIPLDMLLPYLQAYQTWFYGYWPVLSVADLVLIITRDTTVEDQHHIALSEKNAMAYSLACSVCAAIATQMSFVSSKDKMVNIHTGLPSHVYADEAKRVRNLFDYTAQPSLLLLLSSFFLYAHYINHKGRTQQAIVYLREAISICQILGFHEPSAYEDKSAAEIHRWRKIYYMLLVTERFMCFEDGMPVILESCIEFPLLENEEYPGLLVGFTELVRVFSVPDKHFFGEINYKSNYMKLDLRNVIKSHSKKEKCQLIADVQRRLLRPLSPAVKVSDSQKLNIILSQSWIQAIAWHITSENGLLRNLDDRNDCFSVEFPHVIAHNFLTATSNLPLFAFESNGPGICIKLLEIANSLTFAIPRSSEKYVMVDNLSAVFDLVNRFKNDVTLPLDVYHRVGNFVLSCKNFVPRNLPMPNGYSRVEEIFDDDAQPDLILKNENITNNVSTNSMDNIGMKNLDSISNIGSVSNVNSMSNMYTGIGELGYVPGVNLSELVPVSTPDTMDGLYFRAISNMEGRMNHVPSGTSLYKVMNTLMLRLPSFRNNQADAAEEGNSFVFI